MIVQRALAHRRVISEPNVRKEFVGPVLLLSLLQGHVEVVECLLEHKADAAMRYRMSPCGKHNATAEVPMIFAAKTPDILIELMESYAEIDARSFLNYHVHGTVLSDACWATN